MAESVKRKDINKISRKLLCFPYPFLGHMMPMLNLATFLSSQSFSITIIHTSRYKSFDPTQYPHLAFHPIDDGFSGEAELPPSESFSALQNSCLKPFSDCLAHILNEKKTDQEPVACLIADSAWTFAGTVANSFKLPRIILRTTSMSLFLVYNSIPVLRQKGYFPLQDNRLEDPVLELPPLKLKDLPSEQFLNLVATMVKDTKSSQGLICNTFQDIESSAIAKISQEVPVPVFAIGPLQKCSQTSTTSLWTEDNSSLSWLDKQQPKSVIYVSFGSMVQLSKAEFQEISCGLASSMQPFLWVIRPGLVQDLEENEIFTRDYLNKVSTRSHIVKWAPQQKVLAHPAIGGFWSHCGWNSTLESISEGVPMICLPFSDDQPINARLVSDEWKVGLRLEKGFKGEEISMEIRRLMVEDEGRDMRNRMAVLKEKATQCLMEGGSSYESLENLMKHLLSF